MTFRPDPKPIKQEKKAPKNVYEFRRAYGSPIKKKARKGANKYTTVRNEFLKENPACQAQLLGCDYKATEVHHRKGRTGSLLCDKNYFLAVCRNCHDIIESRPLWAKEKGYSLSRLS